MAALSTLRAMPIDVGASVHDTAREACHECPSAKARPKPIHIGVADLQRAVTVLSLSEAYRARSRCRHVTAPTM